MCHASGSKDSQPHAQHSSIQIGNEIVANKRVCQASDHADARCYFCYSQVAPSFRVRRHETTLTVAWRIYGVRKSL